MQEQHAPREALVEGGRIVPRGCRPTACSSGSAGRGGGACARGWYVAAASPTSVVSLLVVATLLWRGFLAKPSAGTTVRHLL